MLSTSDLARDLAVRDLTDPSAGPHAVQLLVSDLIAVLSGAWPTATALVERSHPVVPVEDNYDRLNYESEAVTREVRYTRYVSQTCVLRSHTSAMVPPALRRLAAVGRPDDVALICPGVVYRRDTIDRLHTGTPHQVDLWRLAKADLGEGDLDDMVETVVRTTMPGHRWRVSPAVHPYTLHGRQIDVEVEGTWIEVGECGLAHPEVLDIAGLDSKSWSGLAMGLGLDRILMIRKGIDDIRLLRSDDDRVARQLLDLTPYEPVSNQPAVRRDISIAVETSADVEILGDRVRDALGDLDARAVEEVLLLSQTEVAALPPDAAARLGLVDGQKNVLLRVVLRHPEHTLTALEANELRDRIAVALHVGSVPVPLAAG